jgi:molybdopterin converting factor small subunit
MNKVTVIAKVSGGTVAEYEVGSMAELQEKLSASGYQATVNGVPQGDGYNLKANDVVTFAPKVKGAIMAKRKAGRPKGSATTKKKQAMVAVDSALLARITQLQTENANLRAALQG